MEKRKRKLLLLNKKKNDLKAILLSLGWLFRFKLIFAAFNHIFLKIC